MLSALDAVQDLATDDGGHDHGQDVPAPDGGPCGGRERRDDQTGDDATGQAQGQEGGEHHEAGDEPENAIQHFLHPLSWGKSESPQ